MSSETSYLYTFEGDEQGSLTGLASDPKLFISIGNEVLEFPLRGVQTVGRPSEEEVPDIPVPNRYISRRHGVFQTIGTNVTYTAHKTTNRTLFRGSKLDEEEVVSLLDGDELSVPTGDGTGDSDILFVPAVSETRIGLWRTLLEEAKDARTKLPGKNAFYVWYSQNIFLQAITKKSLYIMEVDLYSHLVETRGQEAADKAVVLAQCAVEELAPLTNHALYQLDESTFAGVLSADSKQAHLIFDAISEHIGNTRLDDAFRVTVSVSFMDLERIPEASTQGVDDLIKLLRETLAHAKAQNLRDCIAEYKAPETANSEA